jgi:Tol biopolymer transport system component
MLWIGADPRFDSLRGNPDFDEIVSQVIPADPLPIHVFDQSNVKLPRLTESGAHAIVSIDDWEVLKDVHSDPHRPPPQPLAPASTDPAPGMGSRLIASIVIVAVAVSAGLLGWSLWPSGASERISLHQKRLTTGGQVTRVAMGPDGRYAAVVQNAAIKLFDLESGEERLLVAAEERMRILTIAFRPDGKAIYFGKRPVETTPVTLYVMPLEGGEPVKILEDVYGSLAFSPDQKKLAFLRRYPELNEFNLLTADIDGTNISKLASSRMPERFEGGPSWSPDGRTILCPIISVEGGFHYSIAMVDPSTGSITSVPNQRWTWLLYAVWLPDSKSVLLTAQGGTDVNAQLWRVDTVTGDAKKVTNDSFIYEALSGSSDGRTFAASKVRQTSHIWIMGDPPAQITTGFDKYDGVDGLAWSPDGALFYHSRASEREAIWRMRPDGSEAKEVTTDSGGGFDVSPDGRFLVFERQGPGSSGLHLMDMSMGTQRQLTQNMLASTPVFSKDGSTIFFSKYENKLSLWEISTALGGEARVVSDEFQAARFPAVSPSGRYTAFAISRAVTGELQSAIAIRDNGSKTIIATVPIKTGLGGTYEKATIQWSPDELELYLLHIDLPASRSNIAKIRIADGTVSSVTDFADGRIFNFAVDPITGRIAFARGTVERDAALIQIERPL